MAAAPSASSTAQLFAKTARVVSQVTHRGRALDAVLNDFATAYAKENKNSSQAALQALSFGTVRWYWRLKAWIDALSSRPADELQPQVQTLLAVALHQLGFSKHPPHAVVHQAVEAAGLLGAERAGGLVNAVLRKFLREQAALRQDALKKEVSRFAHPQWLIDAIRADWPDDWERVLEANNEQPPMWLRINRLRTTVEDYSKSIEASKSIGAGAMAAGVVKVEQAPEAVLLAEPRDVRELPNFDKGWVSVQDAGAQLAAHWLDARPGMRVLDACAAPGGKACHILERTPEVAELVAVDKSAARLKQVRENLERLALSARLVEGDAARPEKWWDGKPFQRILLDVPCSATGVIRRHPDIKVLRRPDDIAALVERQSRLLQGVWPLLEADGRLVYASCSVLRAENERVIAGFLEREPAAALHSPGLQILPGQAGMDGFYYACLEKKAD